MFKSHCYLTLIASILLSTIAVANDGQALEQRLEQLADTLESARKQAHVPGMSIAIVKGDEVIWTRGFGFADVEGEMPADADTIYAIGSTTKAFTATLTGMLVDEGLMAWDDPVTKHLPFFDLQVRSEDADAQCTLRDLLSHRHGFSRMGILIIGGQVSRDEVLRTAAGAEPWDDFRKAFHYSNVMYLAAGQALGVASGSTWDEMIALRIFDPLGMKHTTLSVAAVDEAAPLALGYKWDEARENLERAERIELAVIAPAGVVNSNVLDMAQWLRLLLAQGEVDGQRLISSERINDTWTPQIEMGDGGSYGLGWMLREHQGHRLVEHGGNVDGFSAQVAFLPDEDLGFVLLMNLSATPLREASMRLVFNALVDEPRAASAAGEVRDIDDFDLDEYAGLYIANFAKFRDSEFEVMIQDDGLAVQIPGDTGKSLTPPGADGRWGVEGSGRFGVSFQRDDQNEVVAMTLHNGDYNFELPRKGIEILPEVPAKELEPYIGTYIRAEGGKRVEISIERGRLTMNDRGQHLAFNTPDAEGWASLRARADQGATFTLDAEGNALSFMFRGSAGDKLFRRKSDARDADVPTLAEVLALRKPAERKAAIEAAGGVRTRGDIWVPQAGLRGKVTTYTQGLDRYASHLDFGRFGGISTAVDGWRTSTYMALRGLTELKGHEQVQAMLEHPAAVDGDWEDFFDNVEVLRSEPLNGRATHVLRLSKGDLPTRTYWIDAENGDVLLTKATLLRGSVPMPVTTTYSDFEEVGGIRRATRVETENPASGKMVVTYSLPETGLELGDDVFTLVETIPSED